MSSQPHIFWLFDTVKSCSNVVKENSFNKWDYCNMSADYDLTPTMAPYLDSHLMLSLLDSLLHLDVYDKEEIRKEKIKLLSRTNMLDLAIELMDESADKASYAEQRKLLTERGKQINADFDSEAPEVTKVRKFFTDASAVAEIKQSQNLNMEYLSVNHGITSEDISAFLRRSKFEYEAGQYTEAGVMLSQYLSISQPVTSVYLSALWGRLACYMLLNRWDEALSDFQSIKEIIEKTSMPPSDQIRQRAWLLHWALFVYITRVDGVGSGGVDALADLFAEQHKAKETVRTYSTTMENLCPWLLRYYTAAVILSPSRRRKYLKLLNDEIQEFSYLYSDPITQFLESLYREFDFDVAQVKLAECQGLLKRDFFLGRFSDKFTHEARVLICEMYCTINKRVDLTMLANKLHLSEEEAEKWMVDMIRGSANGNGVPLDAKIDSSGKQVLLSVPNKGAQQIIMDMCTNKDLTRRSGTLATTLETVAKDNADYLRCRGN